MDNTIMQLIFQIERSQKAYEIYKGKKYFYQALRIFEANKQVYKILTCNGELWNGSIKDLIIEYIFHLEDWFLQFQQLRNISEPALEDTFVFTRLEDSIGFPTTIVERLKSVKK